MPGPSSPSTFQRPDLGLAFEEFDVAAAQQGFIGLQLLPIFPVALQTSNFSKIPAEALLAERETRRASGSGYSRQDWQFEQDNYATIEYGAEEILDDRERNLYAYTIDFERVAALRARDAVLRSMEKRIADLLFNTSTFSSPTSVTNEWDDAANATPIADVLGAINTVKANCGMLPNVLAMSDKVFRNLQKVAEIQDRIKYSGLDDPKTVTPQALAALFNIDQVLVSGGSSNTRNSANPGAAPSFADIWDDEYVLLAKIPMSMDLREPGIGRSFLWTGDGASEGGTVEMYREEAHRGDVIRVRTDIHEKVIYASCGHLLDNITS